MVAVVTCAATNVSIVPLWNWNDDKAVAEYKEYLRFNRTFMELKFKISLVSNGVFMFQSYLYGIEINSRRFPEMPLARFQSYLYGIEILEMRAFGNLIRVSIVPLWNWNGNTTYTWLTCAGKFQSYLYGIEIVVSCCALTYSTFGFNRTFMELKCWWLYSEPVMVVFQSYLYGIEMAHHNRSSIHRPLVSIVPLWNWNKNVKVLAFCVFRCFNRTFMELKWTRTQA